MESESSFKNNISTDRNISTDTNLIRLEEILEPTEKKINCWNFLYYYCFLKD